MEYVLKNKILEAEKDQLASQVKEINLKLDLKIFQYSNLEKKNQSSYEAPLLHPMKEDNIENVRISIPNISKSKRRASCSEQDSAQKLIKNERFR